jgi:hypothetical protein
MMRNFRVGEMNARKCKHYLLLLIDTLNTKIGLSIGAVTVLSSLRDELTTFGRSENDRQL